MAFPGVIERPLQANEFSIYLDNTRPIPLSALATFLGKIDREAQSLEGMEGLFLELSDFALGSNELRCRVVGPGRLALEDAARQERIASSAETSVRTGKISAGAAVVSAVAAVVAVAIASGSANPATYRIVNQYNVRNIYVRAPDEAPKVITKKEIEAGRHARLSKKGRLQAQVRESEAEALLAAMHDRKVVDLAGWFYRDPHRGPYFETMYGNHFPIHFHDARKYENSPVALRAIVRDSPKGLQLEVVEVLAQLSSY
jgi:hypothetical protein